MDGKFLRETGAIDDYFTIVKGAPPEPLRVASFQVTNSVICAKWKSVAGKLYRLERTDFLSAGPWIDVSGPTIASGATTIWAGPAPPEGGRCFFRVIEIKN